MTETWVQRGADEYADAIAGELPTGEAWPRDPSGDLIKWVDGCAQIWGDVSDDATDLLLVESDPRFTYKMLADWERAFGLPDPCVPVVQTLSERRVALVNKMTIEGGQSRAFFIALAALFGYRITIAEFSPFQFGLSSFGGVRGRFQPPSVRFFWKVRVSGGRPTRFRFGVSSFGRDSFLEIRHAEDLECMIRRWKPAHTIVLFDYHDQDFEPRVVRFQFGHSEFGDPFTHVVNAA